MRRAFSILSLALALSTLPVVCGCGTHEPPAADAQTLEAHRKQMQEISARERGG